jgi:hypothetical protein
VCPARATGRLARRVEPEQVASRFEELRLGESTMVRCSPRRSPLFPPRQSPSVRPSMA